MYMYIMYHINSHLFDCDKVCIVVLPLQLNSYTLNSVKAEGDKRVNSYIIRIANDEICGHTCMDL